MRYPALVRLAVLLCATTANCAAAHADEVYLKGGGQISGRVVSRSDTKVEVDVGAGRIAVPASRVLRIEAGRSALQEYEERAGLLAAGDAEGWLALGQWAESKGLGSQAREAYHRVLAVAPSDPRANEALGNVQLDGRWVSEDESYRARGYVRFDGQWKTPAEQAAILRERDAVSERDRTRQDAEARARESEARAEEAEARARQAEAATEASDGIPMWYVWGAGPGYWPAAPAVRPPVAPRAGPRRGRCRGERRARASGRGGDRPARAGDRGGADRGRDRVPARGGARRPRGARGAALRAHDRPGARERGQAGARPPRDRAARPHSHRVRVPGHHGRLHVGRLAGVARVETGGVAFARSIEAWVRGRPERLRIVVETVELNPALDGSRFRLSLARFGPGS